MIKDIVFDFGGVLTTIDTDRALQRFRDLGVEEPEQYINSYCQKGPFFELENGDIDAEEFCRRLGQICNREITFEQAKEAWLGFLVEIHTTLLEHLQTLRGSYRLSVLSNTNPFIQSWALTKDFTPVGKSLADYFDMLFFSYRMHCSKPSREIYCKMLADGGAVVWGNVLFLGCVASMLCFLGWNYCLERIGTVRATNLLYLNPVVSIVTSALVLGEHVTWLAILGAVLILAGLVCLGRQ